MLDRLVVVRWVDSAFLGGWRSGSRTPYKVGEVSSVGFVVEDVPEQLTLTTSVSDEGAVLSPLTIPRGCIEEVAELDRLPSVEDLDRIAEEEKIKEATGEHLAEIQVLGV